MRAGDISSLLSSIRLDNRRKASVISYHRNNSLVDRIKTDIKKKAAARNQSQITSSYSPAYERRIGTVVLDIKQKQRQRLDQTKLNLNLINSDYYVYINDASIENPFGLNADVMRIIKKETRNCHNSDSKAKKLFDWFQSNITYGDSKRWKGYSTGQEVFRNKQGVCGEMAFLYVTMARSIGLKSDFVIVDRDYKGDKVHHACAGVDVEKGYIFVDPAYHMFDVSHKKYRIAADREIMDIFKRWRDK